MTTYHFSVGFTDSVIKHHGSFDSLYEPNETIIDRKTNLPVNAVKSTARRLMLQVIPVWRKKQEDVISFEIYYYVKEKEILIFKYEKP